MMNDSSIESFGHPGRAYDFDMALERIYYVTGCHTQQELADLMGIRQSSISDASKRRSIPAKWLVFLVSKYGLSPDWILYGKMPMYLHEFSGGMCKFDIQAVTNGELVAELSRRLNSLKPQSKKHEEA